MKTNTITTETRTDADCQSFPFKARACSRNPIPLRAHLRRIIRQGALAVLAIGLITTSKATDYWWDSGLSGTTAPGTWGVDPFWSTDPSGNSPANYIITTNDTVHFAAGTNYTGAYTVTLGGDESVGNISFEYGTVTISNNTLTLNDNSTITNIVDATIDSVLTGASSSLTITGPGTLTFGGANTYGGQTTINTGTLRLAGGVNTIQSGNEIYLGDNATLDLNGNDQTVDMVVGPLDSSVLLTGGATLTIGALATPFTYTGVISGTGGVTKAGDGPITLFGMLPYTGTTTVNDGELYILVPDSSTNIIIDGGTLYTVGAQMLSANANVNVEGGALFLISATNTVATITMSDGALQGSYEMTATSYNLSGGAVQCPLGTGTLNIAGEIALYGPAAVNVINVTADGYLDLANPNLLTGNPTITVTGGTLDLGGNNAAAGVVNMSSGTIQGSPGVLTATSYNLSGGTVQCNLGTGTLNISGAVSLNGYAAAIAVNVTAGTLALGSSDLLFNGATLNLAGGTLDMGGGSDTVSALLFNGTPQPAGTYGAPGSGAANQSARFTGSGVLTVTSAGVPSSLVLTSSRDGSFPGDVVTFTGKVETNNVTAGDATGTMVFLDGTNTLGSELVANGVAAVSTNSLAVGWHTITVEYSGDARYPYNQSTLSQLVATFDVLVQSLVNPVTQSNNATFSATVTTNGVPANDAGGAMVFKEGTNNLSPSIPVTSGVTYYSLNTLTPGWHYIKAAYSGSGLYLAVTSSVAVAQAVTSLSQTPTTTLLTSSPNPIVLTSNLTLTATVETNGVWAGNATGTVIFNDGVTALGTNAVVHGVAVFNSTALAAGVHSITTEYSGDANYGPSLGLLSQTVWTPVLPAPLAHWRLDDGSGVAAADSSGNGNTAYLASDASWISAGIIGSAAMLCPPDVNETASPANLGVLSQMSWSCWIERGVPSNWGFIAGATGLLFEYRPDLDVLGVFDVNDNEYWVSTATISSNDWHHVVLTWNVATTNMQIYVDGTLSDTSTPATLGPQLSPVNMNVPFWGGGLNGPMQDVWVFNTVLSPPQVQTLYSMYIPPILSGALSGGSFAVSWPTNCLGWELQQQTDSLSTNWVDMAGTPFVNATNVPASGNSAFFRLRYPYP